MARAWLEGHDGARRRVRFRRRVLRVGEWMYSRWLWEPGLYRLTLEAEGYRPVIHEVYLAADSVTRVDRVMERSP